MKTMNINAYGENYTVGLQIGQYHGYNNLAISLICTDTQEPFSDITININSLNDETLACVDINNNPEAMKLIHQYELGQPTGVIIESGWCLYPVYKFDLEKLAEYAIE